MTNFLRCRAIGLGISFLLLNLLPCAAQNLPAIGGAWTCGGRAASITQDPNDPNRLVFTFTYDNGSPTPTPTNTSVPPTATPTRTNTPIPGGSNVAAHKAAKASSIYAAVYAAPKGNDDSISSLWASDGTEANPWWQVDLASTYRVTRLELVSRQDIDHSNSRMNFEVRASNDSSFASYVTLGSQGNTEFGGFRSTWTTNVTDKNPYRYIRVQRTKNAGHFNFAELRVFSGGTPTPGGSNVAAHKAANASSIYAAVYAAPKGNDDSISSLWASDGTEANPWWQVDLASTYQVTRLELVSRQDIDQSNSRMNFEVRASNDSSFASYITLGSQGNTEFGGFRSTWTTNVTDKNPYRYIRVQRTKNAGHFNFAELRVGSSDILVGNRVKI